MISDYLSCLFKFLLDFYKKICKINKKVYQLKEFLSKFFMIVSAPLKAKVIINI